MREWLKTWKPPSVITPLTSDTSAAILKIAEVLFFAGLATEEKEPTRVAVVWHPNGADGLRSVVDHSLEQRRSSELDLTPREPAWDVLPLQTRPFDVTTIAKTSPIAEFGQSALVVGMRNEEYTIDAIARQRPSAISESFVVRTEAPGVVTVEVLSIEEFRFERGYSIPRPLNIFRAEGAFVRAAMELIDTEAARLGVFSGYIIRRITSAMARTRHGGLLLFQPTEPSPQEFSHIKLRVLDEGILQRNVRSTAAAWSRIGLVKSHKQKALRISEFRAARIELERWLDTVGRLTAVDNAVLIGPQFRVLGAQYEVQSKESPTVYIASDLEGHAITQYLGHHGSRHRAAASFVDDGEGRIAVLSSADGPLRCFMKVNGKVVMWPIRVTAD